jgi:hypothetical protein
MNLFTQFLKVVFCIFLLCQSALAQSSSKNMSHFRRNFAIVAFAGIGGAVLGLSTLSFYGSPQDHVGNITTGFLVGLVGGGVYVIGQAVPNANRVSSDAYSLLDKPRLQKPLMAQIQLPLYFDTF